MTTSAAAQWVSQDTGMSVSVLYFSFAVLCVHGVSFCFFLSVYVLVLEHQEIPAYFPWEFVF